MSECFVVPRSPLHAKSEAIRYVSSQGFDTADLMDAKALLDKLSRSRVGPIAWQTLAIRAPAPYRKYATLQDDGGAKGGRRKSDFLFA